MAFMLALLSPVLIVVGGLALYWRTIRRIGRTAGPGALTMSCVDAQNPRSWRALVIDGAGLHLVRWTGREERRWAWSEISGATPGPVTPFLSLVSHTGVHVALTDGSSADLLFPSRTTLRYPPERLDRVMRELARYGKA